MTYTTATRRNNSANLGYVAASSINFQSPLVKTPQPPTQPTVGGWKLMVLLEKTNVGKKEERRRLVQEPGGGGSRERMIFKQQTNKQTNAACDDDVENLDDERGRRRRRRRRRDGESA